MSYRQKLLLLEMLSPLGLDILRAERPGLLESKYPDKQRSEDHARIEAAAAKRRRKLERYTNTPAARMARAGAEWFADEWGVQMDTPEPYPAP